MPRSRYQFLGNDAPYFLTMTVNHWLPVFTRPETVAIVLDSWRYLQAQHAFRLHGYVILENHLHLVAGSPQISRDIQRFKSYTARAIIDHLETVQARGLLDLLALFKRTHKTQSRYQLWEEGSHPQRIESEAVMRQKLDYIHCNPVKRGFVDLPEHWRWSSARDYAGFEGLIEIDRDW
jgi:REP element-mobilizing transposase RayT